MTKGYSKKGVSTNIIDEEGKWLRCITNFVYSSVTKKVSVSCNFIYNRTPVRIGLFKNHHGHLSCYVTRPRPISDEEMKEEMRKLMKKNPSISSNEIVKETGYSKYRLNRFYMSIKKEFH